MIRKIYDQRTRATAKKRGGRDAKHEYSRESLDACVSQLQTPEAQATFADTYHRVLDRLGDPQLKDIFAKKVEGKTHKEIAKECGVTTQTVSRKLVVIAERAEKVLLQNQLR